jgi:hypothetical protein
LTVSNRSDAFLDPLPVSQPLKILMAVTGLVLLIACANIAIRANRKGSARYLTMPFFATPNAVMSKKGERPILNQLGNFDELIQSCVQQLGLTFPEPEADGTS